MIGRYLIAVRRIDRWTVLTLLGVGAFMFWGAGHYTVFDDEAFSCRRYVMPLGEMVSTLWDGGEPDPPLYYVLVNGWTRVFGVGPLGLRSLSILLFLVALPVVQLAGEAWFDRRSGRMAMLLCALHPAHLFFGFAARWYSLMFLMVALLLWLTARLAGEGGGAIPMSIGTDVRRDRTGGGARRDSRTSVFLAGFPIVAAWSLAAAGACYTNYFGPVVVLLAVVVGVAKSWRQPWGVMRWVIGSALGTALYAPWLGTLIGQVTAFPAAEASWRAFAATAARSVLALLTGNLASVRAWWAWLPMVVFGLAMLALLAMRWRAVWPLAVITLGCFAAGVASRTMIDKYIMTFSGPACLLAAALIVPKGARRDSRTSEKEDARMDSRTSEKDDARKDSRTSEKEDARMDSRTSEMPATSPRTAVRGFEPPLEIIRRVAIGCLVLGWFGCGVNLVTQRYWSSLRWLDPFPSVTSEIAAEHAAAPQDDMVVTSHPSARYYFAVWGADRLHLLARGIEGNADLAAHAIVDRDSWRGAFEEQDREFRYPDRSSWAPHTPDAALRFLPRDHPSPAAPVVTTVETAGFAVLPDWRRVQERLDRDYVLKDERTYLEDPEAEWKDRLDPNVRHPRWRIVIRRWTRK